MPRRIRLEPHPTNTELYGRYRSTRDLHEGRGRRRRDGVLRLLDWPDGTLLPSRGARRRGRPAAPYAAGSPTAGTGAPRGTAARRGDYPAPHPAGDRWGGRTHLEQIGVESLCHLLRTEVQDGVTELCCHPGYVNADFRSGYSIERETELRTLCAPGTRDALVEQRIRLVTFRDLDGLALG